MTMSKSGMGRFNVLACLFSYILRQIRARVKKTLGFRAERSGAVSFSQFSAPAGPPEIRAEQSEITAEG